MPCTESSSFIWTEWEDTQMISLSLWLQRAPQTMHWEWILGKLCPLWSFHFLGLSPQTMKMSWLGPHWQREPPWSGYVSLLGKEHWTVGYRAQLRWFWCLFRMRLSLKRGFQKILWPLLSRLYFQCPRSQHINKQCFTLQMTVKSVKSDFQVTRPKQPAPGLLGFHQQRQGGCLLIFSFRMKNQQNM